LVHWSKNEEKLLLAVIILLSNLIQSKKYRQYSVLNTHTCFRLILAAFVVSIKLYGSDFFLENAYYARIGCVSLKEMNALEILFLKMFNWQPTINPRLFEEKWRNL